MRRSGTVPLAVEHTHVLRTALLPEHHRDPFDRLLIAQAQVLAVPIITSDEVFSSYEGPRSGHEPGLQRKRYGGEMTDTKKVAFLVASEGIEKVELVDPWQAVVDAGHEAVLLSPESGSVQLFEHLDKADTRDVDAVVSSASVDDYDALVLPGGVANPDALRMDANAMAFVKAFVESGRPVAAICHASWTLVEADVVRGRRVTSWPSLQTDLRNAGAEWLDAELVTDGNLITSRKPDDLPAFIGALLEAINHGVSSAAVAAR
jgi:protease I